MPTPALDPEFSALLPGAPAATPAAAPAAAQPSAQLDPEFAALMPGNAAPAQTATEPAKALGPWSSAAVRPLVKAVTGLPGVLADGATSLGNLVTGNIDFSHAKLSEPRTWMGQDKPGAMQMPSQASDQLLDKYTTTPQGIGKAAEFVNTMIAGAKLPAIKWDTNVPSNFASASAPSALTGAQQSALRSGQNLGFRATPGQQLGSKALQQVEAKLESNPWTSGPISALKSGNQERLNTIGARAIGEPGSSLDASVLGRANERLGEVFQSVRSAARSIPSDPQETSGVLSGLDEDLKGLLPNNASLRDHPLVKTLEETLNSQSTVNGQQLGSLSSKLGKSAYKQMSSPNGDRDLGKALYAVKDHVDDLVQRTLSGDEAANYADARQQYRTLMQLTSRVNTINPSTGNLSGGALANLLQQTDKRGFLYGRNQSDLYNAARFAQAFKPVVGDSGTATRSANIFNPFELAAGIPANLATRVYLSRPGQAAVQRAMGLMNAPKILKAPGVRQGLLTAEASDSSE